MENIDLSKATGSIQVPLTYLLGYEPLKDIDIHSAEDVYKVLEQNADERSILLTLFAIKFHEVANGSLNAKTAAAWCKELVNFDSKIHCIEDCQPLEKETYLLHPYLRSNLSCK
jgi:hypothetical protein